MSITEKQRQQQAELHKNLKSITDDLRGNMDGNEFKNYILGIIFYRFLSEKIEEQAQILLVEDNVEYETAMTDKNHRPVLEQEFISRIGYVIEPQYLFGHLVKKIEKQAFEMKDLSNAIKNIENSTRG